MRLEILQYLAATGLERLMATIPKFDVASIPGLLFK